MIDEKYWEDQLGNLSFDELKEVTKVINRLKKNDLLKREGSDKDGYWIVK